MVRLRPGKNRVFVVLVVAFTLGSFVFFPSMASAKIRTTCQLRTTGGQVNTGASADEVCCCCMKESGSKGSCAGLKTDCSSPARDLSAVSAPRGDSPAFIFASAYLVSHKKSVNTDVVSTLFYFAPETTDLLNINLLC